MRRAVLSLSVLVVLSGCGARLARNYESAVRNASVVEAGNVATDLVAIDPGNDRLVWNGDRTRILVATWKSQKSYDDFIKPAASTSASEANVVWVTAVPQVQRFCQRFTQEHRRADVALRLKQYLGLNAEWSYDVFVEMWVDPKDLFRPCVDPETSDSSCELQFRNPPPAVKGVADYPRFYQNLYFADFRMKPGVPWTGLGYTYDWGNPRSPKGASEFILSPGSGYAIHRVVKTTDYCSAQG